MRRFGHNDAAVGQLTPNRVFMAERDSVAAGVIVTSRATAGLEPRSRRRYRNGACRRSGRWSILSVAIRSDHALMAFGAFYCRRCRSSVSRRIRWLSKDYSSSPMSLAC